MACEYSLGQRGGMVIDKGPDACTRAQCGPEANQATCPPRFSSWPHCGKIRSGDQRRFMQGAFSFSGNQERFIMQSLILAMGRLLRAVGIGVLLLLGMLMALLVAIKLMILFGVLRARGKPGPQSGPTNPDIIEGEYRVVPVAEPKPTKLLPEGNVEN
jgi:hypothetical protein